MIPGLKPMDDLIVKFQVNIKQGREIVKSCIGHNWRPAVATSPFVNKDWKKENNYKQQLWLSAPEMNSKGYCNPWYLMSWRYKEQQDGLTTSVPTPPQVINKSNQWNLCIELHPKHNLFRSKWWFLPGSLELKLEHYLLQKGRLETEQK